MNSLANRFSAAVSLATLASLSFTAFPQGNFDSHVMSAAASPTKANTLEVASSCGTFVRWVITAYRGGGVPNLIQATEFTLYTAGVPLQNLSDNPNIVVTNPGGASSEPEYNEGPESAYDGSSSTKWLDFAFADSESTLLIQFPEPVTFDSYKWITGGDDPGRDPISWRIDVSSDGIAWATVDTRTNFAVSESRGSDVGPFTVTSLGCGTEGKDFGSGRSDGAKSGPGENRELVLSLDPQLRGRVK